MVLCPIEASSDDVVDIPTLALNFERPVDGLPIFHSWLAVAKLIYYQGYEPLREIVEVRVHSSDDLSSVLGAPLSFKCVTPVKGLGRMSIVLFGILWTYLHKDNLTAECLEDFCRSVQSFQPGGPVENFMNNYSKNRPQNTILG